jgi:hypothetical protein
MAKKLLALLAALAVIGPLSAISGCIPLRARAETSSAAAKRSRAKPTKCNARCDWFVQSRKRSGSVRSLAAAFSDLFLPPRPRRSEEIKCSSRQS